MYNEEDRKWLYDKMKSSGIDTGNYDDFKNSLNNDEDREWYYNKSIELGLDVGSPKDFDDMMVEKKPEPAKPQEQKGTTPTPPAEPTQQRRVVSNNKGEYGLAADKPVETSSNLVDNVRNVLQENVAGEGAAVGTTLGRNVDAKLTPEAEQAMQQAVQENEKDYPAGQVNNDGSINLPGVVVMRQQTGGKPLYEEGGDYALEGKNYRKSWYNESQNKTGEEMQSQYGTQATKEMLGDRIEERNAQISKLQSDMQGNINDDTVAKINELKAANVRDKNDLDKINDYSSETSLKTAVKELSPTEKIAYDKFMDIFHKKIDELDKAGEAKRWEVYQANKNMMGIPGVSLGVAMLAERMGNKASDPMQAINAVLDRLWEKRNGEARTQEQMAAQEDWRSKIGMMLLQAMQQELVKKNKPKNAAEYILGGLSETDLGQIVSSITKSDYQRYLDQLANAAYDSNMLERVLRGGVTFAGDMWEFVGAGKLAKIATKGMQKRFVRNMTEELIARGVEKKTAKGIAERLLAQSTGKQAVVEGAHSATMGAIQGAGSAAIKAQTQNLGDVQAYIAEQQAQGKQFSEEEKHQLMQEAADERKSFGATIKQMAEQGAWTGATFGLFPVGTAVSNLIGYGGGVAQQILKQGTRLAVNAGTATGVNLAEQAVAGEIPADAKGKDQSVLEMYAETFLNFALLELPGFAKRLGKYKDIQAFEKAYHFTDADKKELRDAGYDNVYESVIAAAKKEKPSVAHKGEGYEQLEDVEGVNEGMKRMMEDPNLPETTKRKVYAMATGDYAKKLSPVVSHSISKNGNKYILERYNQNGDVVSREEFRTYDAAESEADKYEFQEDLNHTAALENSLQQHEAVRLLKQLYNKTIEKDESDITEEDKLIIALYRNKDEVGQLLLKKQTGGELSQDQESLIQNFQHVVETLREQSNAVEAVKKELEEEMNLSSGDIEAAMLGHSKKEVKEEDNPIKLGNVYRTGKEHVVVQEYRKLLLERLNRLSPEDYPTYDEPSQPLLEERKSMDAAYSKGYDTTDEKEMQDAKYAVEAARERLISEIDEQTAEDLDNDPFGTLRRLEPTQWTRALDYINAKAAYDGMIQRVRDGIDSQVEESNNTISQRTNKADGQLHPADTKYFGKVFIVDGQVTMLPDGTMVDKEKSDQDIIVIDEQGKTRFIPAEDILSVDEPINAEEESQRLAEEIRQSVAQEAANKIDGTLPFQEGDTYEVTDEEGAQHTVQVVQDLGDGTVTTIIDGQIVTTPVSKEQIQAWADNAARIRREQKEAEEQPQGETPVEETPATAETETSPEETPATTEEAPATTEETPTEEAPATTEEDVQPTEEDRQEPMPMVEVGGKQKPDWSSASPARAHAYIYNERGLSRENANAFVENNRKAAEDELKKLQKKQPKMGTDLDEFDEKNAAWQQQVDAVQQRMDYWSAVKQEQDKIAAAEQAERAEREQQTLAEARAQEQQRQQEELAKQAEQAERGANAVAPAIREKWQAAPKVEGVPNEIVLANGERVPGRYILVESGAATPSHNPNAEFARNEGFPVDVNDQSVNDRDYERDKNAQDITRQIAGGYDSRALQTPVVVSKDGVVLSGNGRTMAGELAAQGNTDGAYIDYLKKYGQQYGFTPEQVEGMQHPRVLFVPDNDMPYTAETFAKFNQQEMKGQSKTEQAVKLGKVVDDSTFNRIIRNINNFDTLGEFYADTNAATEAINELLKAGAINQMQYGEMFDGDTISEAGRQMLENMLIGKAFESNPDAVRQLTEVKSLRQNVVNALADVSSNLQLGEDYNLESELAQAIELAYRARKSGFKLGDKVSGFARQQNLFQFDEGATVADYTNMTILMLADAINGSFRDDKNKLISFKKILANYNSKAADSAVGQADIFSGGVKTKEDILREVLEILGYGKELKKQAANTTAVEQPRSGESAQQDGATPAGNTDGEATVEPSAEPAPVEVEPVETEPNAVQAALAEAEQETNTEPTEAQKEAGNYKKGHVKIDGYDVTIENPKGSVRRGTDASGKQWEQEMQNTYGYIRGTEGVDGDHIDVFFSDDPSQGDVFVVDQVNKDGSFDEHKVMYGFPDIESARKAYLSNYEDGWQGLGAITPVSKEEFKKWIDSSHRKTKPFAEYSSVKPLGDTQVSEQEKGGKEETTVTPELKSLIDDYSAADEKYTEYINLRGEEYDKTEKEREEAFRAAVTAKLKLREALNSASQEELEYLKSNGSREVRDMALKEQSKREEKLHVSETFDERIKEQGEITGKGSIKPLSKATVDIAEKNEQRPVMGGVYHDPEGYGVVSDGHTLVASKELYDKKNKEKIIAVHELKSSGAKKGEEIKGKYPKWRMVIPQEVGKTAEVNWQHLSNFLAGVTAEMKKRWQKAKEEGGKESFATFNDNTRVALRMPDGTITVFRADSLAKFVNASQQLDAKEIEYTFEDRAIVARGKKGLALQMPVSSPYDVIHEDNVFFYDSFKEGKGVNNNIRFERASGTGLHLSEEERRLGEALDGVLEDILGDDYSTDWVEGMKVLDADRERRARLMGSRAEGRKADIAEKDKQETEKIFDAAKEKFGTTYDIREAGYILPDGTMLDFSGKHELDAGTDASFLKGQRSTDHREISKIAYDRDAEGNEIETGIKTDMPDFIERGAIRIDSNAGTINLSQAPTDAQKEALRRLISRNDGYVSVDFGNGWDSDHYVEYDGAKALRVLSDINKYFNEGIRPQGDFIADAKYQKVAPVFYSNAEHAVEGIKQEKATPEQWLKMIEKAGGLKAGEDKWLGLSDWLKGQDKKSLTKQEVLDYIRENQVQVEETRYQEGMSSEAEKRLDEFNSEFEKLIFEGDRETGSIFTSDWVDYAYEEMVNRYGDDFRDAFDIGEGTGTNSRLTPSLDYAGNLSSAAKYFLGMDGENSRPIEPTRLDYTTDGLTNKREIALTVPTIESWNQSDEIHFGDADDGRAVAWIRFGETMDADGKRVLVIDEIQSKRHQEGREKGYKTPVPKDAPALIKYKAAKKAHTDYLTSLREKYGRDDVSYGLTKEEEKESSRLWRELFNAQIDYNSYLKNNSLEAFSKSNVPDAPFEKNWHELAMKRMLRYAAENGYDKVAWTTGEQQAERYDLGQSVEKIQSFEPDDYAKENGEYRNIQIDFKNDGKPIFINIDKEGNIMSSDMDELRGKKLSEVLGKNLADKILSEESGKEYSGEDLRIGGEGMKGFYDQMLPRFMDKYGKKWGVKVGEVELPNLEKSAQHMWSIDVTPEMKKSVTEGQPMFFRTETGEAYGFTLNGKIYIDPRIATSETRVHEYAHLWAQALRKGNPKEWQNVITLMKGTSIWDEVKGRYPELQTDDDVAEEVLAHYSGRRGAERLRAAQEEALRNAKGVIEKAQILSTFDKVKQAIKRFWKAFADFLHIHYTSAEEVADRVMADLLDKVNPKEMLRKQQENPHKAAQLDIVTKENPMQDDYHTGIRSIDDIRTFEEAVKEGEGIDSYPDYTQADADKALSSGKITVYSSKPIRNGAFVSASRMEAKDYAGGGKVYSKEVPLEDVAWIYANEGQYAKVEGEPDAEAGIREAGNAEIEHTMQEDADMKRTTAEQIGEKLNIKLNIIEDVDDITHPNAEVQERRRRSKGWYDTATGEVYIILPNNADVDDVKATIGHETVAHKGLRELIGEERYNDFLDETYSHLRDDLKQQVDDEAGKTFLSAINKQQAGRTYEECRRTAVDELFGRLAEKPFEEFSEGERTLWQKIKATVRRLLDKFLGSLKLPKRFELGDNELRYILWRSKEHLERGREHPIDLARDIVKREELGLTEENTDLYREPDETEEYDAGRKSLSESLTEGLIALANKNRDNLTLRINAMRAIGGNLSKLRQAMARQREYDKETVNNIVRWARVLMNAGYGGEMTKGEVSRLIGMIGQAAAREDITKQANAIMDLMITHNLRACKEILSKQLRVKGSKLNSSGVEVQAGLDIEGQRMVGAFKDAMALTEDALATRIEDTLDRMGSSDKVIADNAAADYQGLLLAQQYLENIKNSEVEEKTLKQELKTAKEDYKAGNLSRQEYKEYVASIENALRENKLDRIEAYGQLVSAMGDGMRESVERAKEWREREKERVNEIHHNANSDLNGVSTSENEKLSWWQKANNWSVVRFFAKPLATFDSMLRYFGSKSVDGRGYLFNRFMGGWIKAADREWRNLRAAHNELDEKVSEVMGKEMRWSNLFDIERKMPTVPVEIWDAGEKRSVELTQGNLLYIYMVNKMSDGKMKLRRMGITEEDVDYITEQIDPRFKEIADWVQEEFLTKKREEYNKVYERMFGSSMAAIDNYFPLKINSRSRGQEEDIGSASYAEDKPATITGSVIKRTRNSLPLDLLGADAFDVVLEHLQDMEHWAAFAEFSRDLNTLLSYRRFKNRVLNMSSTRYGAGEILWKNFKDVCAIAAGTYQPIANRNSLDKAAVNVAKGVTAAKISLRIYTALKQLLSYPADSSEASVLEMAKSTNPIGAVKAWNWAIEELPGFAERWESRQAGDSRLKETDNDWSVWKNKIVEIASRWGMSPNAFVDGLTVAMGAKAIYETKYKKYKKMGYPAEKAKEKALQDASMAYNETQQSSGNAYLSAMQVDRTLGSVALTVFRNASMGYERRMVQALSNLKNKMRPGYRQQTIEFMKKEMVRDGLTEEQAEENAKRMYNHSWFKDVADTIIFGFVLQAAWNLGPYLPYLLAGDDDDEKDSMLSDALWHALAGGIEGLSGGNLMSDLYNNARNGTGWRNFSLNLLPLMSDIQNTVRKFDNNAVAGWNEVFNIIIQSGVGVNPQTITDAMVAIMDYTNGNPEEGREIAMLMMRLLQMPQSSLDKLYIDELQMSARDAKKLDVQTLAKRYIDYKRKKEAPLTDWAYSDEMRQKVDDKYSKRFENLLKERIEQFDDEKLQQYYDTTDPVLKKSIGKEVAKRLGGTDSYGSPSTDYGDTYLRMRDYIDLAEDILLQSEGAKAKQAGDTERENDINAARNAITAIKKELAEATSEEERQQIMQDLREERKEWLNDLNITHVNK